MKIAAAVSLYFAALGIWAWAIQPPEPRPPAFQPIDIRFCPDWRDGQFSRCETIPFRKEVAI